VKIKLLLSAIALLAGLFLLNRWLNQKKEYIAGVPAADTPAGAVVREKFVVGFLPVT
jgi:hypothetical protein